MIGPFRRVKQGETCGDFNLKVHDTNVFLGGEKSCRELKQCAGLRLRGLGDGVIESGTFYNKFQLN